MAAIEAEPTALGFVQVLDLSENIAGQYCCRMLADYGAEVLLIEPPAGSAVRRMGPFQETPGAESESLLFHNLNLGKSSIVIDQTTAEGMQNLERLIKTADIIIAPAGFDRTHARSINPHCIINTVSPFGEGSPKSSWRGSEMIYQAMSGMMTHNGRHDREPLYGVGHRASYCAGIAAYTATLAALMVRERTGIAQDAAVDIAHTAASMTFPFALQYSYNGSFEERGRRADQLIEVKARDCWIAIFIRANMFAPTCEGLGAPQLATDPRFEKDADRRQNFQELVSEVQKIVANRNGNDVVSALQSRRVVAACSFRPTQLGPAAEHLKVRDFWQTLDSSRGSKFALGPQFRMSLTPRCAPRPAPILNDGRGKIAAGVKDFEQHRARPGITPGTLPLSGFRIVEVTTAWAGPMAGRILAYLGAEVIHIESSSNLDSWRSYTPLELPKRYPDMIGGPRRYNRAALFNSQNTDKLSLSLNLRSDRGKEIFRDLIARSDGLLTNFTPGMLGRLGFSNDELQRINERLCIVEMPAFGNSGIMRSWTALGPTMEQVAGMAAIIGYGDGRPVSTGPYYLDPIGAFNGSAAMMTALLHRQRSGQGQKVEMPQVEAAMHLIGEYLIHAIETGTDFTPNGNRRIDASPHDVFPARGDDEWVAIAVETDDEWRSLCRAIGSERLLSDTSLESISERIKCQDEISAIISEFTRSLDKHEAARLLQEGGVPAAAVYKADDALTCDYLNAREFSVILDHPEAGRHLHQGLPYRFEKTPVRHRTSAPCLGEHNRYILREVLGRTQAAVEELERSGVIRSTPDSSN